jgi:hypothetical protein
LYRCISLEFFLSFPRTDNKASLSIEEVCAALKNRGGFTGNYHDLVEYVKQFFDEAAYQLCDGFAVNTGYFLIHLNVGVPLTRLPKDTTPRNTPPVSASAPWRNLAEHSEVEVEGLAEVQGYIDECIAIKAEAVNETFTPGNSSA